VETMQEYGNRRAAMIYEAALPDGFRRPTASDEYALDKFIRAKYERKQFYKSKTKEQLDHESTHVRNVEPVEVHHSEEARQSSGKKPVRRQPPPSNVNSGLDFGVYATAPTKLPSQVVHTPVSVGSQQPSVGLLPMNLLSMESETSDFGSYTSAPAPPTNVFSTPTTSTGATGATKTQQPPTSSLAPIPIASSETRKAAIMGMFEPPAQVTYNAYQYPGYGSQSYPAQAGYSQQQQQQGYASQGYYNQAQQQPYGYSQQQQFPQQQWAGYSTVDPILSKIQTISQEKRDMPQATGLASLLI